MGEVRNETGNNVMDYFDTESDKAESCMTVDMKALLLMMNYSEDDFIINIFLGEETIADG